MDRDFEKLKREALSDPENNHLTQRLADGRRRVPQKELDQAIDVLVLFFTGLAKVLVDCREFRFKNDAVEEDREKAGKLLRLWQDYVPSGSDDPLFKLIHSRLREVPDPAPPSVPRNSPLENPTRSIWVPNDQFLQSYLSVLRGVQRGNFHRSELDIESLCAELLEAVTEMVNHCFEDGNYAWTFDLLPAPELGPDDDESTLLYRLQREFANSENNDISYFGYSPRRPERVLETLEYRRKQGPLVAETPNSFPGFWPTIHGNSTSWGNRNCYFGQSLHKLLEWYFQSPVLSYDTGAEAAGIYFYMSLIKTNEERFYLRALYY